LGSRGHSFEADAFHERAVREFLDGVRLSEKVGHVTKKIRLSEIVGYVTRAGGD
jgi:hypothetical protein